jgi:hypothetical protein
MNIVFHHHLGKRSVGDMPHVVLTCTLAVRVGRQDEPNAYHTYGFSLSYKVRLKNTHFY